jgi:hypothetical protein
VKDLIEYNPRLPNNSVRFRSHICRVANTRNCELIIRGGKMGMQNGQPSLNICNLSGGTVSEEKPQSRQTKRRGNNNTVGLSIFLRPWNWIPSSLGNSI